MVSYMANEHKLSVQKSCICIGLSRAAYYRAPKPQVDKDEAIIEALNELINRHGRWGFWKCYRNLRGSGHPWNHKRVHRIYCTLGLNHKRRAKRSLPKRERHPLSVPEKPNQIWSADFMSDSLYAQGRFRTFNIIDDFNREVVAIEIDTSLTANRLIRVFETLKLTRGLPDVLRVDNGPEFRSGEFTGWAENKGIEIRYIQAGKPNQNAYIERFNWTYREELLDLYIFESLEEVREKTYWWKIAYNEERPHDALGHMTPAAYLENHTGNSNFDLST